MKGFALFLSLMLMLLLTLLGFCLLVLASQHYFVTHTLYEKENSRLACDSAIQKIVARHNLALESPRFFFDPQNWQGTSLKAFLWNGYSIWGDLDAAWSSNAANLFLFTARKGTYVSRQFVEIRQMRLEDFALYSEQSQQLPLPSLFAGSLFARGGTQLQQPVVRFLDSVYPNVQPVSYASFKHYNPPSLDFPALSSFLTTTLLQQWALQSGLLIPAAHPVFWKSDHYELNLNQLQLEQKNGRWKISYAGSVIGEAPLPFLYFDGNVDVRQTPAGSSTVLVTKPKVPLYIGSLGDLRIQSNLTSLEDSGWVHPLALLSGGAITINANAPSACRIDALIVALGAKQAAGQDASLIIDAGGIPLTEAEKQEWQQQLSRTQFLIEDEKRNSLLQSLQSGEKIVWFQRTVVINKALVIPPDLKQLHFQSSKDEYALFRSLPFVLIVEGSRQWL